MDSVRFNGPSDASRADVRFTPESGHEQSAVKCPLSAKSGHSQLLDIISTLFFESVALPVLVEEVEMITDPNHDAHRDETVRGRRERKRHEKALDEALKNTFPASDPVSVEQPVLTATHE
ncbi:MAG: hypothetical protein WBY84_12270 [Pseudolabrys sp.]